MSTKKTYQQACDYQSRQFGKMAKANTDPAANAKTKQGVRRRMGAFGVRESLGGLGVGGGGGWGLLGFTYFIPHQ